jgi:hypothetical protein
MVSREVVGGRLCTSGSAQGEVGESQVKVDYMAVRGKIITHVQAIGEPVFGRFPGAFEADHLFGTGKTGQGRTQ